MRINIQNLFCNIIIFLLFLEMGSVFSVFFSGGIICSCILLLSIANSILRRKTVSRNLFVCIGAFFIFFIFSSIFTKTHVSFYLGLIIRVLTIPFIYSAFDGNINELKTSLKKVLKFIAILGLINFLLINFIPDLFSVRISESGFSVNTLLYIFNFNSYIDIGPLVIFRNQGLFWEPGVFQIAMNILLYLLIIDEHSTILKALLPIILIITTFSTTGLLVMGLMIAFTIFEKKKSFSYKNKLLIFLCLSLLMPIIYSNVNHKIKGEGSESAALRTFDLYMGMNIAIHNPIWGIGPNPETYLANTKDINLDIYKDIDINSERGNTNTFIACMCYLGIPFTLYFGKMIYNQKLFRRKRLFFSVLILMFFAEPLFGTLILFLISMSAQLAYK